MAPPFKPPIHHPLDVANFAEEFTKQQPCYSPVETPDSGQKALFRVGPASSHFYLTHGEIWLFTMSGL